MLEILIASDSTNRTCVTSIVAKELYNLNCNFSLEFVFNTFGRFLANRRRN